MRSKLMIYMYFLILLVFLTSACSKEELNNNSFEEPLVIMYSMRTLTNPYYNYASNSINYFAESLDEKAQVLIYEHGNNDENQLVDIKRGLAQGNKKMIAVVDGNSIENMYEIGKLFEEAGVYWTSIWTRPSDMNPEDYKYYVSHQSLDDYEAGYTIAKYMFDKFDRRGKGKIIAIHGSINNEASINRRLGLMKALGEYPNVELLEESYSNWEIGKAKTVAENAISKYEKIDGIWVANDGMASAVIDVLEQNNMSKGIVKVVGIDGILTDRIKSGDLLASVSSLPWVQASYGAAIAYGAYEGQINPSDLDKSERVFYTHGELLTEENIDNYILKWIESDLDLTYENPYKYWYRGQ